MYPAAVLRQIKRIKEMMALDTIDEIQREFLFARGFIESGTNAGLALKGLLRWWKSVPGPGGQGACARSHQLA